MEYYKDNRWQLLTSEKMAFSNVQEGTEMIARISSNQAGRVPSEPYQLVLGSYPVLSKYDLLDEPGVVRIQGGRTEPQWLATQAYKQARLEVKFTDSQGTPLEGAEVFFKLKFENGHIPEISRVLISDAKGVASQIIELGKCEGGKQAGDFVDKNKGFNTWRSHYEVGVYVIVNALLGTPDKAPHVFYLGHICKQKLIKTVRPRN